MELNPQCVDQARALRGYYLDKKAILTRLADDSLELRLTIVNFRVPWSWYLN